MEQTHSKGFYNSAMKYGTYLGIFWAMIYILLLKFSTSPTISMIAVAMFIGSPFVAYRFAANYRKNECGNCIKFPQAWTFLFCMYICATLFSGITNYIYFGIIDQGRLLIDFNVMLSQIISSPEIDEVTKTQFENIQAFFSKLTIKDIVLQLLNNNIFNSLTLPPVIALFVKKTS
ncbi:MAG: DUF4199 domain-containing protein [Bacteroidaceae bacterium]|nr:DUF4199 domain-containing protein [Bacteroidaceae bacterium]